MHSGAQEMNVSQWRLDRSMTRDGSPGFSWTQCRAKVPQYHTEQNSQDSCTRTSMLGIVEP